MKPWIEQRHAPLPGTYLCQTTDIGINQVMELRFSADSPFAFRLFIYNDNGNFRAYRNACPHFDVPLNHTPEDLFTADNQYFQCMTHFAQFEKSSGLCISGPCIGQALDSIPVKLEGERLIVGHQVA